MKTYRAGFGLLLTLMLLGCPGGGSGPEGLTSVSGTVTLDGEPLADATVIFTPTEGGRPSVGVTDSSGDYELEYSAGTAGALPGKYTVSITTETVAEDEEGNEIDVPEKLAAKYNANTELTADVDTGSNTIDFPLESGGEVYQDPEEQAAP